MPELLRIEPAGKADFGGNYEQYIAWKDSGLKVNFQTEGLQVCLYAYRSAAHNEKKEFSRELYSVVSKFYAGWMSFDSDERLMYVENATYEQRLIALCQVFYPEQFREGSGKE